MTWIFPSCDAMNRRLELSPAVASAALKRLEAALGCRLLVRSTRSLRLTGEGEQYLPHARSALQSLLDGQQLLAGGKATISGPLLLSAPLTSAATCCCRGWTRSSSNILC